MKLRKKNCCGEKRETESFFSEPARKEKSRMHTENGLLVGSTTVSVWHTVSSKERANIDHCMVFPLGKQNKSIFALAIETSAFSENSIC